jgi:hypothetical protein
MRRGALQATFVARWGEGGDPASLSLNERFFPPFPPFGGIAGLATGDFSSPSGSALRVRMRRAGVLDAWEADWTIARFRMEWAACMQKGQVCSICGTPVLLVHCCSNQI